jgi:hypothetical protein
VLVLGVLVHLLNLNRGVVLPKAGKQHRARAGDQECKNGPVGEPVSLTRMGT